MFGLSSRSGQRKEPTWTQTPSSGAHVEPVWRDQSAAQGYEPTRQQTAVPRKRSSGRIWGSVVLALLGLLIVAYLLLRMFSVVEDQVARNQPRSVPAGTGGDLMPAPVNRP